MAGQGSAAPAIELGLPYLAGGACHDSVGTAGNTQGAVVHQHTSQPCSPLHPAARHVQSQTCAAITPGILKGAMNILNTLATCDEVRQP